MPFPPEHWGLILGGSSGFGLAAAKKLASHGLNLVIVHRDRRGAMKRIDPHFEEIRAMGVGLLTVNADALSATAREEILTLAKNELGESGRFRVLLHSIALGNLKPLIEPRAGQGRGALVEKMSAQLGVESDALSEVLERLFAEGCDELHALASPPDYGPHLIDDDDITDTVYNMGGSLLSWVRAVMAEGLFSSDARVLGLTSEGNTVAWRGYAAIAAAKVTLESLSRAMALELAPYGIRSNIIQAGITETPASTLIPGIAAMKAQARLRNPFGRLTRPEDVAGFIYLMCLDEAAWVNGALLRVDGGEHVSGGGM